MKMRGYSHIVDWIVCVVNYRLYRTYRGQQLKTVEGRLEDPEMLDQITRLVFEITVIVSNVMLLVIFAMEWSALVDGRLTTHWSLLGNECHTAARQK